MYLDQKKIIRPARAKIFLRNFEGRIRLENGGGGGTFSKKVGTNVIAVITIEPGIIYSFVKKGCERGERVNTSEKAM